MYLLCALAFFPSGDYVNENWICSRRTDLFRIKPTTKANRSQLLQVKSYSISCECIDFFTRSWRLFLCNRNEENEKICISLRIRMIWQKGTKRREKKIDSSARLYGWRFVYTYARSASFFFVVCFRNVIHIKWEFFSLIPYHQIRYLLIYYFVLWTTYTLLFRSVESSSIFHFSTELFISKFNRMSRKITEFTRLDK